MNIIRLFVSVLAVCVVVGCSVHDSPSVPAASAATLKCQSRLDPRPPDSYDESTSHRAIEPSAKRALKERAQAEGASSAQATREVSASVRERQARYLVEAAALEARGELQGAQLDEARAQLKTRQLGE